MRATTNRPTPPPMQGASFDFDVMRKEAESRQLLMRAVPLQEITIVDASHIKWDTFHLALEGRAFKDLMGILGMTKAGGFTVVGAGSGEAHGSRVLDLVRAAVASAKKMVVILAADKHGSVHRIYTEATRPTILAAGYFNALEGYLQTDDFVVDSYNVSGSGRIGCNLRVPRIEAHVANIPEEWYTPGVSMTLGDDGISVSPFTFRWICSNGLEFPMVHKAALPLSRFTLSDMKEMQTWMGDLAKLQSLNYVDPSYEARVKRAIATPASYAEVLRVDDKIHGVVDKNELHSGQLARFTDPTTPEQAYRKAGISYEELTRNELKSLRADRSVWDLVNQVTDFASHDHGLSVSSTSRSDLRRFAGTLLLQQFDCETEGMRQAF